MALITDGLLIATCLTAALYCIILSRRLSRFSDTKSGIGQQISQLNAILEETRANISESQKGAKSVAERLARDLASANKSSQDLGALIERAESMMDRALELNASPPRETAPPPRAQPVRETRVADPVPEPEPEREAVAPSRPVDDELTPIEEELSANIASRDFDLADAKGEPQLGFLPTIADEALEEEPTDATDPPNARQNDAASSQEENLLKVERMAL